MTVSFWRLVCAGVCVLALSVSVTAHDMSQSDKQEEKDPSKGSIDVDSTVPYAMPKVLEAAKQALTTYGCDVKKEKPD